MLSCDDRPKSSTVIKENVLTKFCLFIDTCERLLCRDHLNDLKFTMSLNELPIPTSVKIRSDGESARVSHRTFRKESSHLEVTGGESDDGSLVELVGDGWRQWQQLGQFKELGILLLASCSCCVL